MKKGRLTRAGGDLARKINFYDPQPPKTRSYAEKSTSRWIWLCQKDRIVTIQQLTLVLGRRARKGAVPLFTHRPHPTANFITSVPRQRWVPNSGKQTAAPLPRKGTGWERSFYIEKTHSARRFPSRTSRACSLPKQKTQRLCVSSRWVPILSTHNLKRLASARHSRKENCTLTRFSCTLQTNQSVKTKKLMMYSNRWCFFICIFRPSHAEGVPRSDP